MGNEGKESAIAGSDGVERDLPSYHLVNNTTSYICTQYFLVWHENFSLYIMNGLFPSVNNLYFLNPLSPPHLNQMNAEARVKIPTPGG